jgi:hypothetical protein
MRSDSFLLLILVLSFSFVSCNKALPAGFWKNYHPKSIVKKLSDQGPRGGHRAVYWKNERKNFFSSTEIIDFAFKNGWTFMDSIEINAIQTGQWIYDNKPVFPLSYSGFNDTALNTSTYNHFPRWFGGNVKIYKFKTGWITIEPGTDNSNEVNGFVLLNENKNEMAIYHLWGE